jgi:hypothetical protein
LVRPDFGGEDGQSAGPLFVEVTFGYKILIFPVGAMRSVMRDFALDCMLTASLASPEWAGIIAAEDTSLMKEPATRQLVLDSIQVIHFLSILLTTEVPEGGLSIALRGSS